MHGLDPTDAQAIAPRPPSEGTPLRQVDIHRMSPLTRMNQALIAHSYRWERIPEEQYPTWQLDSSNPEHRDLLVAQKVQRKGPGNYMFPEHFYYRYFDYKYLNQKHFLVAR